MAQSSTPNTAPVFKAEIVCLARNEFRSEVDPIRKALAAARTEGAALKRRVSELERSERQSPRAAYFDARDQPDHRVDRGVW